MDRSRTGEMPIEDVRGLFLTALMAAIALLVPTAGLAREQTPDERGPVCIYSDPEFSGARQYLSAMTDDYMSSKTEAPPKRRYDMASLTIGDNQLSALTVKPGYRVTLYEYEFAGRSKVFTSSARYVGDDFDNLTTSILVELVGSEMERRERPAFNAQPTRTASAAGKTVAAAKEQEANCASGATVRSNRPLWDNASPALLTDGNRGWQNHGLDRIEPGFAYEIRLAAPYTLSRIVIWARQDGCCPERLSNYRISVHRDDNGEIGGVVWKADMHTDGTNPGSGAGAKDELTAALDPGGTFSGQWIRILSLDNPVRSYALQISEVEAFGVVTNAANPESYSPARTLSPASPRFGLDLADSAVVNQLAREALAAGRDAAGFLAYCCSRVPSPTGPLPLPQFLVTRNLSELRGLVSAVSLVYEQTDQETLELFLGAAPQQEPGWIEYATRVAQSVAKTYALTMERLAQTLRSIPLLEVVTVVVIVIAVVVAVVTGGTGLALVAALTILMQVGVPAGTTMGIMKRDYAVDLPQAAQILKQASATPGLAATVLKDQYQAGLSQTAVQLRSSSWSFAETAEGLIAAFNPQAGELAQAIKNAGGSKTDIADALRNKRGSDAATAAQCLKDLGFGAADATRALKDAGYSLGDVARAIKDKFGLGRDDLKSALDSAGFSAADVAQVLVDLFGSLSPPPKPSRPRWP